jgi:acetoin utilization deacetylase AcuC-like enzyme
MKTSNRKITKKMNFIYDPKVLEHDTGNYPENRKRIEAFGALPVCDVPDGEPFLSLVHDENYIQTIKDKCARGEAIDEDTVVSSGSFRASCQAAGAAVLAAKTGDFALVRPPGHHAFRAKGSGFCLFNNIAIAAQYLVNEGKKVVIFDFDGHHGDGTANIFYDSDQVLFISIHQFPAFPYHSGWLNEIGEGKGKGYTINVPLPPQSADDIFWDAVDSILPYIEKFQPDAIGLSAGFDAHQNDPLLDLGLSVMSYYKLGKLFSERFDNVFAVLEGGYNVDILTQGVYNFLAGYMGLKPAYTEKETASPLGAHFDYELRLNGLFAEIDKYWK